MVGWRSENRVEGTWQGGGVRTGWRGRGRVEG